MGLGPSKDLKSSLSYGNYTMDMMIFFLKIKMSMLVVKIMFKYQINYERYHSI